MIRGVTILMLVLFCEAIFAQDVSREEAYIVAKEHMEEYFPDGFGEIESFTPYVVEGKTLYYIINLVLEGWLIISGDKGSIPVLAFDYNGHFIHPQRNISDPLYNWLRSYAEQIELMKLNPAKDQHPGWDRQKLKSSKSESSKGVTVKPIIDVEWNQGSGWNRFCPEDDEGPGDHAYVGCVAVAMAHAMSVYSVPDTGVGIHSYTHSDYGSIIVYFFDTEYNWDSMSVNTSDNYNALLLYHCAVSVDMDFGPDGSSALITSARRAMGDYFRMSKQMEYKRRFVFGKEWKELLIEELVNNRPIIYKGDADDGEAGHAFNIDGVVNSSYFHLNWGWSGSQNGFFTIDDLTPGTNDFTNNHAAIFGIQPFYYPTDVALDNILVPEDQPSGTSISEISVVDEAIDNEYIVTLLSDSTFISSSWVKDYYIDGDTLRIGRLFPDGEMTTDTIWFTVTDLYDNYLEVEKVLLFEDTSGSSTAIDLQRLEEFVIYPNPASDYLFLQDNSGHNVSRARIYSIIGNRVRQFDQVQTGEGISLTGLSEGIYIIEVECSDGIMLRRKFIKQY